MSRQTKTGPLTMEMFHEAIREAFERGLAALLERAVSETRRRRVTVLPSRILRSPRRGTRKRPPSEQPRRGARRASSRPAVQANRVRFRLRLLEFVAENPGCSAIEIGRALGISEEKAERTITRLVARGQLARTALAGGTVYAATRRGHLAPGLPHRPGGRPAKPAVRGSGLAKPT
jgi:hypothetical protein